MKNSTIMNGRRVLHGSAQGPGVTSAPPAPYLMKNSVQWQFLLMKLLLAKKNLQEH